MPRLVDLVCKVCGKEEHDRFFMILPDAFQCSECGGICEEVWYGLPRSSKNAQWLQPVVIFKNQETGQYRFPGRSDAKMPAGHERVEIRSDAEMGRFEKEAKVLHESRWFDSNGKGFDQTYRGERMDH